MVSAPTSAQTSPWETPSSRLPGVWWLLVTKESERLINLPIDLILERGQCSAHTAPSMCFISSSASFTVGTGHLAVSYALKGLLS